MMNVYYLLIKTNLQLNELSQKLQPMLLEVVFQDNPFSVTERDGINYGGQYYLFKNENIEIALIRNSEGTRIEGFEDYNYYLFFKRIETGSKAEILPKELSNYLTLNNIENKLFIE